MSDSESEGQGRTEEGESNGQVHEGRPLWLDILKTFLTPVTIAGVSAIATYLITDAQLQNANQIAELEQNRRDAVEQRKLELERLTLDLNRLSQITTVFQKIIKKGGVDATEAKVLAPQIRSLAVYGQTALPFVVGIKDHFSQSDAVLAEGGADSTAAELNMVPLSGGGDPGTARAGNRFPATVELRNPELARAAEETLDAILSGSQLDLRRFVFHPTNKDSDTARKKDRKPLRFGIFSNFNLTEANFNNTNLYRSDLSRSTLVGAQFFNTDLYGANLEDANLTDARFGNETNLINANFRKSKLTRTRFHRDVYCIERALFSLDALLRIEDPKKNGPLLVQKPAELGVGEEGTPLFDGLDVDRYARLLIPYVGEIEARADDVRMKDVLKKFDNEGIVTLKDLAARLRHIRDNEEQCVRTG